MTRRQLLYTWLKENPGFHKMEELTYIFAPFCHGLPGRDGRVRRVLTADIQAINESTDFPGVIYSGNRGIKFATRDEAIQLSCSTLSEAFRMVRRARAIQRKIGLDGQYTTDERNLIDAFIARNFAGIRESMKEDF